VLGVRATKEKERNGKGLSQRSSRVTKTGRGKGGDAVICHGGGELSLGGSSGRKGEGRGKRREARRGEARATLGLGATRVGEGSRRWRGAAGNGGRRCCSRGAEGRGAEQGSRGAPEEEEEGRGSEGPLWNFQKSKGLLCEVKFPTDPEL
jgi:hypothetical protein